MHRKKKEPWELEACAIAQPPRTSGPGLLHAPAAMLGRPLDMAGGARDHRDPGRGSGVGTN